MIGFFEVLGQINYLAVIVCTAVAMVLGSLWYSPVLFGNTWTKCAGLQIEEIEKKDTTKAMIISTISSFIGNMALASIIIMTQTATCGKGLALGALVSLGLMATSFLTCCVYEKRSLKLWMIHTVYYVIYFTINGGIMAIWN